MEDERLQATDCGRDVVLQVARLAGLTGSCDSDFERGGIRATRIIWLEITWQL